MCRLIWQIHNFTNKVFKKKLKWSGLYKKFYSMCNSSLNIAGMNFIKLKSMTISVVLDHTINLVLKLFFYHNCIMEIVLCHYNAYMTDNLGTHYLLLWFQPWLLAHKYRPKLLLKNPKLPHAYKTLSNDMSIMLTMIS